MATVTSELDTPVYVSRTCVTHTSKYPARDRGSPKRSYFFSGESRSGGIRGVEERQDGKSNLHNKVVVLIWSNHNHDFVIVRIIVVLLIKLPKIQSTIIEKIWNYHDSKSYYETWCVVTLDWSKIHQKIIYILTRMWYRHRFFIKENRSARTTKTSRSFCAAGAIHAETCVHVIPRGCASTYIHTCPLAVACSFLYLFFTTTLVQEVSVAYITTLSDREFIRGQVARRIQKM